MKKLWLAALLALAPFAMNAQTLLITNSTACPVSYHVYADPMCVSGSYYNINPETVGAFSSVTLSTVPGFPGMPPTFTWNAPPPTGSLFNIFKVITASTTVVGEPGCSPWPPNSVFQCGAIIYVDWITLSPGNYQVDIHY